MDRKKNNDFKNAQNRNDLKNHNEKRKAQDSDNNELKDTQKFNKFD
jgi:hypothetical protein